MVDSPDIPQSPEAPLIVCRNLAFHYTRHRPLLRGVQVELQPGIVSLIGPNGAGKSTLLNLLSGWLKPTEGTVSLNGTPLAKVKHRELARLISVVPQLEEHVFPYTLFEVVEMGLYAENGLARWSAPEARARVKECLQLLEIDQLACSPITECSGGERQLALVARALVGQPQILLLDEPTSFLDPRHQRQVLEAVQRWAAGGERLAVFVTHDLNLATAISNRILLLHEGRLFWDGTPEALIESLVLQSVYGTPFEVARLRNGQPLITVQMDSAP